MPFSSRRIGFPLDSARIFFISLALMAFEIDLVRVFSVIMMYHLAFFVLAIALFGIGLGGLYAHIMAERRAGDRRKEPSFIDFLPVLLSASILLALVVLVLSPLHKSMLDYQLPALPWFFCAFIVAAIPFFLGGMFVSLVFSARPKDAGKLYFSDLAGASIGCLLAIPILEVLGGLNAPFVIAVFAVIPSFFSKETAKWPRRTALVMAVVALVLLAANIRGQFLDFTAGVPGLRLSKWNFYSNITVFEDAKWQGWRLSPHYKGPVPQHLRLNQDGRAPAFIDRFDGDFNKVAYLRYDITSMPFRLKQPKDLLVIGAGGGRDILTAKLYGVPRVKGVELNPITAGAMRNEFKDYSGNVYGMDGVDVVIDNGRTFAKTDTGSYDLIFVSLADTQAANAQGAYVLSENHLYTVEAFESYWDRLKPDGACSVVGIAGWGDHVLRMASTMSRALEKKGVADPSKHIIVIMTPEMDGKPRAMCILFSKQPIDAPMMERAKASCAELGFFVVWPPQPTPHEWTDRVGKLMKAETRPAVLASLFADFSPLEDKRPYFYYPIKPASFLSLLLNPNDVDAPVRPHVRAFHMLIDLFMVAFVSVLLLMLSPLILFGRRELHAGARRAQFAFLAIFFLLGLGYMMIEVSLLQQLFLFLGNPTLTFAVTLCAMLAFTGLGSLISNYAKSETLVSFMAKAGIAVVVVQSLVCLGLPALVHSGLGAGEGVKGLVVAGLVGLLATPMGMLFPSAIRLVGGRGFNMTCWAWGMNGVGSVLGSVVTTIISMNFGILASFVAGTVCYALVVITVIIAGRLSNAIPTGEAAA